MKDTTRVLFIDNVDSFVFNLVDEFARRGCDVEVRRNDTPADEILALFQAPAAPHLLVLSPGPGSPSEAGCCLELIRRAPQTLPLFGVCLGHQAIIEAEGGTVGRAGEIVHGKTSLVEHDGSGPFAGLQTPLSVGRYHSLVGTAIPPTLRVTARHGDMVMAVEHTARPMWGVQFHPESILTARGGLLLENLLGMISLRRSH